MPRSEMLIRKIHAKPIPPFAASSLDALSLQPRVHLLARSLAGLLDTKLTFVLHPRPGTLVVPVRHVQPSSALLLLLFLRHRDR